MISETDAAYIAGLFDGEGSISYKQYMRKKPHNKKAYPIWQIRMEISMTDKSVLTWLHLVLGVGTLNIKKYKSAYTKGWKKQWRWRCSSRDAYYVCLLIQPYAHTKVVDINKIIKHYSHVTNTKLKAKVIDIANYKIKRKINEKNFNIDSLVDLD
tara:strand:+ start:736 stop:1200 length:465 start_codon:yes stop_codon:yes gene_type:complete